MKFSLAFLATVLPLLAAALPTSDYVVHESRTMLPSGWVKSLKMDGKARIPMRIGLKQQNIDKIGDMLMDVSDPASPNYGNHMTASEVVDVFAPSSESVETVRTWLVNAGIEHERIKQSKNKLWIEFEALIEEAEALLKTDYHVYLHPSTGTSHMASGMEYSLPADVSSHVDIVMPTMHYDIPLRPKSYEFDERQGKLVERGSVNGIKGPGGAHISNSIINSNDGFGPKFGSLNPLKGLFDQLANCSVTITPICLEALYKFTPDIQVAASRNSYGVVEYSPVGVLNSDIKLFESNYSQRANGYLPNYVYPDQGTNPQLYGQTNALLNRYAEGNLDVTYAIALTYPVPLTVYQVGPQDGSASFNTFLDAIDSSYCTSGGGDDLTVGDPKYQGTCGEFKPTNVISTSYAYNEADLPLAYEVRQCNEYAKLGLQGVSFLFSSGDNGVAGNSNQCINPGFTSYNDGSSGIFNPSFPGTCPYITSVGATQIPAGKTVLDPECATYEVIFSGGGFSNNFAMPSYQKNAVAKYFADHKPPYTSAQYNNSMMTRGFPDVSANGARYAVPIEGKYYHLYGTSASSPTFGSIITLVNGARIGVGKKPLGFLNPWLYSNPWVLKDITNGTNPGCGTQGFSAVSGWDPLTGLGTPMTDRMLASALLFQ